MSQERKPICPACKRTVEDTTHEETLQVYADRRAQTEQLLNAVGYNWPNSFMPAPVYIHMACLEPHLDKLDTHRKVAYQAWRIRQLEADDKALRREIQHICQAIQAIDEDKYFRYIEEPSLKDPGKT